MLGLSETGLAFDNNPCPLVVVFLSVNDNFISIYGLLVFEPSIHSHDIIYVILIHTDETV